MEKIVTVVLVLLAFTMPVFAQTDAGKALLLDGKGDYVNFFIPDEPYQVINSTTFTLEAWVLMKGPGGGNTGLNPVFVQRDRHADTPASTVHLTGPTTAGNPIRFVTRGPTGTGESDVAEIGSPAFDSWHHYAAVADSAMLYLYVDGVLADSSDVTPSPDYVTSIDYIEIGRHIWFNDNAESTNFLNGLIDEVRIWNRPLSHAEILEYKDAPLSSDVYLNDEIGLVAYWTFDELEDLSVNGDGADDIRDLTGNGFDGDLEGNPVLTANSHSGNFNQALELDGQDDYVNLFFPNQPKTLITSRTFTVEMWALIKGEGGGNRNFNPLFVQREEEGATHSSTIHLTSNFTESIDQDIWFGLRGSESPVAADTVATEVDTSSVWHHYAIVSDSTTMFLYVDGLLAGEKEINHTGDYATSIDFIEIGRHIWLIDNQMNTNYFNGIIDEVRVWNTARTADEIRSNWDLVLCDEDIPTMDDLVAYWRFDEIEDHGLNQDGLDDINDLTGNRFFGDLVGGARLVESTAPLMVKKTGVARETPGTAALKALQNYPNPFRRSTTIQYSIGSPGWTTIKVYDILGKEVVTLIDAYMVAGEHEVVFDRRDLPGGMYFYKVSNAGSIQSSSFVVIN